MLEYVDLLKLRSMGTRLLSHVGVENIVNQQAGAELWRSPDGENWVPVSTGGIGNKYNLGVRNLISSNNQLIIGTANPFGPTVYTQSKFGTVTMKTHEVYLNFHFTSGFCVFSLSVDLCICWSDFPRFF